MGGNEWITYISCWKVLPTPIERFFYFGRIGIYSAEVVGFSGIESCKLFSWEKTGLSICLGVKMRFAPSEVEPCEQLGTIVESMFFGMFCWNF